MARGDTWPHWTGKIRNWVVRFTCKKQLEMSGEIHNYLQCSKDWLLLLVIVWIFAKQVDVDDKN